MAMTIRVYRVNPATGQQTDITPSHIVRPVDDPPQNPLALPPCTCIVCRNKASAETP